MIRNGRRHLRVIPGEAPHVLLVEASDQGIADVVCTCGEQWYPIPVELLDGLAEWHEGALFA